MTPNEIARVQDYLRRLFANDRIAIDPPARRNAPVEVRVGQEFIGVLHRDEEDGEVSYALQMTILAEDLPAAVEVRRTR
jgi:hypothetical protein